MNDLSLQNNDKDDLVYESGEMSMNEAREASGIATELLMRGSWSGADREALERIQDMKVKTTNYLDWVHDIKAARDREEALKV